ncbi:MAG: tryptophan synthase subunit alpha [Trueperaceae bacterium]|nr:tryptophan synthase subunit alpha [Trueperaceae bacterium]MCC6310755.1 tryptophan synthase subunit alpha [Trueperaceae bacterium]MCO5174138.1 tryptophan synthase subunit alpha [Trueperaceae bacterium]
MSRIADAFARARADGRAAFVAYLTASYPDDESCLAAAEAVLRYADVLELGLPFSDPLGDGPVIQRASEAALAAGASSRRTLDLVGQLRARTSKPILIMSYYNPIYCYPGGEGAFVRAAKAAGADGLILPDLPPDEGQDLIAVARAVDLDTVFLVAPTSTPERLRLVTAACRGFVYAVSVTGVTGARADVPAEVADLVAATKAVTDLPVAVGFGVANRASATRVARFADGVVVGSAIVSALGRGEDLGRLAADLAAGCVRAAV